MSITGTVAVVHKGALCDELVGWLRALPQSVSVICLRGYEIAAQRNVAVRQMQGNWLLFVDSDMAPLDDTLERLLAHRRPVIGAVMIDRHSLMICTTKTFEPTVRYDLSEVRPERGAMAVLATGTGCLLVHRRVFDAMHDPWFTCGQLVLDCITEDTEFCIRAAEAGFATYLACDVRVGHVVSGILWPSLDNAARIEFSGVRGAIPIEAFA